MKLFDNSELQAFVEMYFKMKGALIEEKNQEFFIVKFPDGKKEIFTYLSRVAADNKDIKLIAKGSKVLRSMVEECSKKTVYSQLDMSYNFESVNVSLKPKVCCDLCPFFTMCEHKDNCCDFCNYFKNCNSCIKNAELVEFGEIKNSRKIELICFIFSAEISNDYSLSNKIEKMVMILVDLKTFEVLDSVLVDDILSLDLKGSTEFINLDESLYHKCLQISKKEADKVLNKQLEVFKGDIEGPLNDKIRAIINKYEEEYTENYARMSLEQLEEMQKECLELCNREIRGYTINVDYHLRKVIILRTIKDKRELIFKLLNTQTKISILADIFLSRTDISCSQCGLELDLGYVCKQGHVICKSCADICSICGDVICNICDDENYICSTCGEIVCHECKNTCSSCGAILCNSHAYKCKDCDEIFCIDCYEVCSICDSTVCLNHSFNCKKCNESICKEHSNKCEECGELFCNEHINLCDICNKSLCGRHSFISNYSMRQVCKEHIEKCNECGELFVEDEVEKCSECGKAFCPNHIEKCNQCEKIYCSDHINKCMCCGEAFCECTKTIKCKLCGEEYCQSCVDKNGYCRICNELNETESKDDIMSFIKVYPEVEEFNKFYIGKGFGIKILYSKSLLKNYLLVLNNQGELIRYKKIGFLGAIVLKKNLKKKSR